MGMISPAVADAFRLLRTDLYSHLDEAEFLASKLQEWSPADIERARQLIPDLLVVIRGLLGEHEVDPSGVCRICASAWPCPVVTTIHELVTDPDRLFVTLSAASHPDE